MSVSLNLDTLKTFTTPSQSWLLHDDDSDTELTTDNAYIQPNNVSRVPQLSSGFQRHHNRSSPENDKPETWRKRKPAVQVLVDLHHQHEALQSSLDVTTDVHQ